MCGTLYVYHKAGQEQFKSITRAYYKGSIGALVVYDITIRKTFESVVDWLQELRTLTSNNIIVVLVANKLDLVKDRQVKKMEGEELANKMGAIFIETSAKESYNIDEV